MRTGDSLLMSIHFLVKAVIRYCDNTQREARCITIKLIKEKRWKCASSRWKKKNCGNKEHLETHRFALLWAILQIAPRTQRPVIVKKQLMLESTWLILNGTPIIYQRGCHQLPISPDVVHLHGLDMCWWRGLFPPCGLHRQRYDIGIVISLGQVLLIHAER